MSRFTRFTRISPAQLLCRRERRAWFSLSATLGVLAGTAAALGLHSVWLPHSGNDMIFHGVAYTEPEREQHLPQPVCRAVTPVPNIVPHPVQADPPDVLLPEEVDDSELAALAAEPLPVSDETGWDSLPAPTAAHKTVSLSQKKENSVAVSLIHAPHPTYPERMRQRCMEGDVSICIHIDASGAPTAVDILTEVHPDFAEHTRRWILRHWRFRAAHNGATAIVSTLRTTIRYRLDD